MKNNYLNYLSFIYYLEYIEEKKKLICNLNIPFW